MNEVLLSRPILQSIGFDLDRHLETVRDKFHDADFSHVGSSSRIPDGTEGTLPLRPGRLARLLLSRNYGEGDIPLNVEEEGSTVPDLLSDDEELSDCSDENEIPDTHSVPDALFYGDNARDDHLDEFLPPAGLECPGETRKALGKMLREAMENNFPKTRERELRDLVGEYSDIFRTKLGSVRRYSPPQAKFLPEKVDELLHLNLVKPNNSSEWA